MSNLNSSETKPVPLSIFIADDEAPARARLQILLEDISDDIPCFVAGEASNGDDTLLCISQMPVDVALLDIRMPGVSGLELAKRLNALKKPPIIIFTTAYDKHALEAFEVSAIDYLVKPIRAIRLASALEKVQRLLDRRIEEQIASGKPNKRDSLISYIRGKVFMIPISDIVYLKADLKYVTAYTASREFLIDESLTHLEKEFAEHFIRLHRSILVARDALIGFEHQDNDGEIGWVALVQGRTEKLPVSRRQWSQIRQLVQHDKI